MGSPVIPTVTGSPSGNDQANTVVSGTLTAAGQVSTPFPFFGAFNVSLWLSETDALTTSAGSATATFNSGTGLAAGQGVSSTLVPAGTTIAAKQTTTVTLGGLTNAQIAAIPAGTDASAVLTGKGVSGDITIQLERSFDAGATWLECNTDKLGTPITWQLGSGHIDNAVTFVMSEPERGVSYRLHCTAAASGTANYRISATGWGATTGTPPT